VEDSQGNILYQYDRPQMRQVLSPQLAWLTTDILSDNPARWAMFGRPNVLEIDRPAAVKTGTTNDFRDNWTIGGTPQLVAAVWVGNNDNAEMEHVSGVAGAAPIWHDIMLAYHKDKPVITWERPGGLVDKYVCDESGLLPTRYCPTVLETFIEGTEPKATDNLYQAFLINKESGKLATVFTPAELIEERSSRSTRRNTPIGCARTRSRSRPASTISVGAPSTCVGDVAICTPTPYSYVRGARRRSTAMRTATVSPLPPDVRQGPQSDRLAADRPGSRRAGRQQLARELGHRGAGRAVQPAAHAGARRLVVPAGDDSSHRRQHQPDAQVGQAAGRRLL
jgi:membrane peptidoglycan carboxypeptidase